MARDTSSRADFVNGVPELLILALLERQAMHGYQLIRAIAEGSGGRLDFPEGSIYPALHRMERDGLITSVAESVGGRQRYVYSIARAGRKRLAESTRRWKDVVIAVEQLLAGRGGDEPRLA